MLSHVLLQLKSAQQVFSNSSSLISKKIKKDSDRGLSLSKRYGIILSKLKMEDRMSDNQIITNQKTSPEEKDPSGFFQTLRQIFENGGYQVQKETNQTQEEKEN